MTAADDPRIGQTIDGRYVVRRFIGKGGMGAVYEAEQPSLGRAVAIKFLLAQDAAWAERFRREARHASKVVHEHVAQVHDVGTTADGQAYLVMEYIPGTDLGAVVSAGALPVTRAVAIAREMLEGLDAIHALGVIHRDVKPSNVLLTTRGDNRDFVKVADFGLARAAGDAKLTKTGNIVGTTPFMAPEMFRGDPIDHRADLYAVGITLYQMLAGKLPFVGATAEIGAAHVWQPPPPLGEQRPGIPAWLVRVVERALAKAPADRYQSARAFIAALDRKRPGPTVQPTVQTSADAPATVVDRPAPRVRRPVRWPWIVAALVIVGGGAIGAYIARPAPTATPRPVHEAAIPVVAPDAALLAPDAAAVSDAAVTDAAVTDAAVVDAPRGARQTVVGSTAKQGLCMCISPTVSSTPLCAKQGTPRCRCATGKREPPLCTTELVACGGVREWQQASLGTDMEFDRVCWTGKRCSDLDWMKFVRPATHGAKCSGVIAYVRDASLLNIQPEGEHRDGTWECDTCPGADNQTYRGVEGDHCTGYHWQTGEPVDGTLQHCD